jgi:hypothetical protein
MLLGAPDPTTFSTSAAVSQSASTRPSSPSVVVSTRPHLDRLRTSGQASCRRPLRLRARRVVLPTCQWNRDDRTARDADGCELMPVNSRRGRRPTGPRGATRKRELAAPALAATVARVRCQTQLALGLATKKVDRNRARSRKLAQLVCDRAARDRLLRRPRQRQRCAHHKTRAGELRTRDGTARWIRLADRG